jgi:hypothetical protein
MAGWSPSKVDAYRKQYIQFTNHIQVNSKEDGTIVLGENRYNSQRIMLNGIFTGLSQGKNDFKIGKSRQLGCSTESRAFTLFWAGMHPGQKGYFVTYEGPSLAEARLELEQMTDSLPSSFGFPKVVWNRDRGLIRHGPSKESVIMFAAAGTKENSRAGKLGVGSGISFVHATELSLWVSERQLEAFVNSLAENNPNRLYIWESTGRGFDNVFPQIWENAKADSTRQVTIFLGWWSKETQMIPRDDPAFAKYGNPELTQKEADRIRAVRDMYGQEITIEQLAWYRRRMDPSMSSLSADASALDEDPLKVQEQPFTEIEMFLETGTTFFSAERLNQQIRDNVLRPVSVWEYEFGVEFPDTKVRAALSARSIQLKVWEEPCDRDAVYVVSGDPAGGSSEKGDRSCVQVNRCYADGIDQVAEFASKMVGTQHFAWVIATLLGQYLANGNEIYFILEVNGPGEAVLMELKNLKTLVEKGYLREEANDRGFGNIFRKVKQFYWSRADALRPSASTVHFKTTAQTKRPLMDRFRDFVHSGALKLRSQALVTEMRTVTIDGDAVSASAGHNDDRVIGEALAVRMWEDRVRNGLSKQRRTRATEENKEVLTLTDRAEMFSQYQLGSFFAARQSARMSAARSAAQRKWRGR